MKDEEKLEKEFTLELPEYLLVHLRIRARQCGCTVSFMIRKILIEEFRKLGVNVFREKVDKRSAAYRKGRKPYRRKNPDMESIGEEKPKRKRGRPPGSKNKAKVNPSGFPPVLSTNRVQMEY